MSINALNSYMFLIAENKTNNYFVILSAPRVTLVNATVEFELNSVLLVRKITCAYIFVCYV